MRTIMEVEMKAKKLSRMAAAVALVAAGAVRYANVAGETPHARRFVVLRRVAEGSCSTRSARS